MEQKTNQELTFTQLNELLTQFNFSKLERVSTKKYSDRESADLGKENNSTGDEQYTVDIYKVTDTLYLKVFNYEDSYGNDEQVVGLEFVTPKVVQITEFQRL